MKIMKTLEMTIVSLTAICLSLTTAHASEIFKADVADNLDQSTSWSNSVAPTSADVAAWDSTIVLNTNSVLGANLSWSGIKILDPANTIVVTTNANGNILTLGASGIDLSLATQNLTLNNALALGANQTWNVGSGLTLTLTAGSVVSGTSTITKSGAGTLVMSAANTYSGGTLINDGVLQAGSGTALGTGTCTNNNGTTLRVRTTTSIPTPVNFNGTVTVDLANVVGNAALIGSWSGGGTVNIINQDNGVGTITNRVFTICGGSSANMANFTGKVSFGTNSGTLRFNDGGSSPNTGNSSASFDLGTGTGFFYTRNRNAPVSFGELTGGANTTIKQGSSSSGTSTYSIGGLNTSTTFAGSIVDGGTSSAGFVAINKVGTGILTLTGTNTYAGGTTVTLGTLQAGDGGTSGQLGTAPIVNSATLIFNRSDDFSVPNAISGTGTLIKTNANILTFNGTNSSSGTLAISTGTVAVGSSGSIRCPISLASGAFFDVSLNSSFILNQILSGSGTVTGLLSATNGSINPGGMGAAGTLSFANGLTELGNVSHQFEFTTTNGANDLISITGDLTLNNTNTIIATHLGGGTIPEGIYTLFTYTGNLNGGLANLALSGADGVFTNPPNKIQVIIAKPPRPVLDLTWYGDGSANSWDTTSPGDWKHASTNLTFQSGDSVTFDNAGAANPTVNIPGSVLPASVVVNAANDYTLTGIGNIGGGGTSLVKTNSGRLTIATVNSYTGPTIIGGGILETLSLNNGNAASGIGAASSVSSNLVIYGGATLKYSGTSVTSDRGAKFAGTGAIIDVTNSTTLTLDGPLDGSGSMVKSGAGTLAFDNPNNYSGGTVISNGVIALNSNAANDSGANNALGLITSTVTFNGGTLQLYGYNGSTSPNYNTFRSPLVVPAGQSGTLRLFSRGPSNSSGLVSSLTGDGTLNLVVNYVRDNLDGDWSGFNGLINVTAKSVTPPAASEFRINNGYGYANATIYLNNDVIMDRAGTANSTVNIGALTGDTNAIVGPGNGSALNPTWSIGWKNTSSTYSGHIRNDGVTSVTKVGTGTLTFNGGLNVEITTDGFSYFTNMAGCYTNISHCGPTIISNGVLQLVSPVTLTNTASTNGIPTPITLASATAVLDGNSMGYFVNEYDSDGYTLTNIALFTNGVFELAPNQSLTGIGTILASNVLADAGSLLKPGLPLGTLYASQKVELAGAVTMSINPNSSPNCSTLSASTIQVDGSATLTVTNLGPEAGGTFQLFNHAVSGFASITLPQPTGTNLWVTNLAVNGSITLLAPPAVPATPPVMTNSYDAAGGKLTLSWGAEYKGLYRLLAQTNSASTGLSGNWVEWAGASATNKVVITIDNTKDTVFFRLVYP